MGREATDGKWEKQVGIVIGCRLRSYGPVTFGQISSPQTQNTLKLYPKSVPKYFSSFQSEEPGERLSPGLLLLPGDSMITLNKFNEDDDDGFFLGGFNEDGSFIGDYMDTDPEQNRAVMNRLVGFQQLFSKQC